MTMTFLSGPRPGRLRSSNFAVALLLGLCAGACGADEGGYDVLVTFADLKSEGTMPLGDRVDVIDLSIVSACPDPYRLRSDAVAPLETMRIVRGEAGPQTFRAPAEAGAYGLLAVGRVSSECSVVAIGCSPIVVERGGSGTLPVSLAPMASPEHCGEDEMCNGDTGECEPCEGVECGAGPDPMPDVADNCDGVDNDDDGAVDEDMPPTTFYADDDGDGFGNDAKTMVSCSPSPVPQGFVVVGGDCLDINAFDGGTQTIWGDVVHPDMTDFEWDPIYGNGHCGADGVFDQSLECWDADCSGVIEYETPLHPGGCEELTAQQCATTPKVALVRGACGAKTPHADCAITGSGAAARCTTGQAFDLEESCL
jgi:hypothetical protein